MHFCNSSPLCYRAFNEAYGRERTCKLTILLDGTQLTHTYYQLKSTGANVVCSNVDELTYSDTLEFNKLVRDKIPEKIISNGEHVRCSIVSRPLLDRLLLEKLLEEAYEVYDAN